MTESSARSSQENASTVLSEVRPLVLGSGSPRRREILTSLRVPFVVRPGQADETVLPGERADAYLARIARAKLAYVRAALPADVASSARAILVADTSVILEGDILGKPADIAEAEAMIARLQGRTHDVQTRFAIAFIDETQQNAPDHEETVTTRVTFRTLSAAAVRAYAASGEGLDKAGAYAVQGLGAAIVARLEGSYTNVVGLPACEVVVALERLGLLST